MSRTTFREITLAIIIFAAIVAAFGFCYQSNKSFERAIINRTQDHLLTIAKTQARSIEQAIGRLQSDMKQLSQEPDIQDLIISGTIGQGTKGRSPEERLFGRFGDKDVQVNGIYRLDAKGIVQNRIPAKQNVLGADFSEKEGVKYVLENHESYVSGFFVSNFSKKCFSVCEPVFKEGKFVGIVRGLVYLNTVQEFINHVIAEQKGDAYVFDSDGTLIASPNPEDIGKDLLTTNREIDPEYNGVGINFLVGRMIKGESGIGSYDSVWRDEDKLSTEKKLVAFAPVNVGNKRWSVAVSVGLYEISEPVREHSYNLALGGGGLVMTVLFAILQFHYIGRKTDELESELETAKRFEGINRELTDQMRRRKRAEESNINLLKAMENAQTALNIISPEGEVIYTNNKMDKLFGYSKGELIGKPVSALNIESSFSSTAETILDTVKDSSIWEGDIFSVHKDGTEFTDYVTVSATRDSEGNLINILSTHSDITKQKQDEEQLNRALEEVRQFDKLVVGRDLMMAGLKHEVNELCHEMGKDEKYPEQPGDDEQNSVLLAESLSSEEKSTEQ
ncbi:MAG: PAS domain S-box protein [Planctomycetes bacterium]|nr:PAS domain S-box protein [Planctomycetota bacterium]